jgi:hypothetical protein
LGGLIIAIPFVIEPETASVLGRWLPLAAIYTLLFFVAGMAGAYLGRPIARLAARLLLPAKLRVVMSYLWVVDGKAPPEAGGRD